MHKHSAYNPHSAVPPTPHGSPSPELDFTDDAKVEEYILKAFKAGAQQPASSAPSSVTEGEDSSGGAGPEKRAANSGSGGEPVARKRRRRGAGAEDPPEGAGEGERASGKRSKAGLHRQIDNAWLEEVPDLRSALRLPDPLVVPPDGWTQGKKVGHFVEMSKMTRRRLGTAEELIRMAGLWPDYVRAIIDLEHHNRQG